MNRIAIDHRIMGGVPCVRGIRVPVATVLGLLAEGLSPSEVLAHYPQLAVDDVLACLRYAARVVDARTSPAAAGVAPTSGRGDTGRPGTMPSTVRGESSNGSHRPSIKLNDDRGDPGPEAAAVGGDRDSLVQFVVAQREGPSVRSDHPWKGLRPRR